jgi:hypothetical protein
MSGRGLPSVSKGLPGSIFGSGGPLAGLATGGVGSLLGTIGIPGVGPILGALGIAGIEIPGLSQLLDGVIGLVSKKKQADLPEGYHYQEGIRYTGDGPYPDGDIIVSDEYDFPVARWSYDRQKVWPLVGLTLQGYCLFLENKTAKHSATGQDVTDWTGHDAETLNAQAGRWAVQAAEFGVPGGAPASPEGVGPLIGLGGLAWLLSRA